MMNCQSQKPHVSYTIITYNRKDELGKVLNSILEQDYAPLEIVVVDNNSDDDTESLFARTFKKPNIHYIKLDENKGVSGGRNVAINEAQGDIIVTIDDDAVLTDPDATQTIVNKLVENPAIGILAFKIIDYYTGEIDKMMFPCRDKSVDPDKEFETTWFIGAGHAIRKAVYDHVGLYRDYAPWGSEEFDFSLRAIDAGFRIQYFPEITVIHKRSLSGRISNQTVFRAIALKHRIKAVILNLPWYSFFTFSINTLLDITTLCEKRGNTS